VAGTVVVEFGSTSRGHCRFQAQLFDRSFWLSLVTEGTSALYAAAQGGQFRFGFRGVDVFDPARRTSNRPRRQQRFVGRRAAVPVPQPALVRLLTTYPILLSRAAPRSRHRLLQNSFKRLQIFVAPENRNLSICTIQSVVDQVLLSGIHPKKAVTPGSVWCKLRKKG